jgi:GR25 family glycosyltransferase involved in LPS biosynthesis
MEHFDIIYYINLAHRDDRKESILSELKSMDIPPEKIHRIDAVYCEHFGALGCSKSHILALEHFVQSGLESCIIFEDDFVFTETKQTVQRLLNEFFVKIKKYDVLMLSSNTLTSYFVYGELQRIIDAQTASGYCVHKGFAKKLLNHSKIGSLLLEKNPNLHNFACDMYWKRLQPISDWFCLKVGKQKKVIAISKKWL